MSGLNFDIAIIGAGPAGCAAALTLRNSNCSVALFEKASFPRNKICGDYICDRSVNTLKDINPAYFDEFLATQKPLRISTAEIEYQNHSYRFDIKHFGYNCKRLDFDNFLFSLVQRDAKNVSVFQNCAIRRVERTEDGLKLYAKNGEVFFTKMLLVCCGASSKISRELTGSKRDKSNLGVAVRAYYSGVKDLKSDTIEFHFKKEYYPGYLWIFPMADGTANVGFGCLVKDLNGDMRSVFQSWIANDDALKQRFADAKSDSPLVGGLIPHNIDKYDCFGDNFCVCGDAANLIDPITGGGIGNAMVSGYYAAQVAEKCVLKGNFSKTETGEYSKLLRKRIGRDTHNHLLFGKMIMKHRWLLSICLKMLGKFHHLFH